MTGQASSDVQKRNRATTIRQTTMEVPPSAFLSLKSAKWYHNVAAAGIAVLCCSSGVDAYAVICWLAKSVEC